MEAIQRGLKGTNANANANAAESVVAILSLGPSGEPVWSVAGPTRGLGGRRELFHFLLEYVKTDIESCLGGIPGLPRTVSSVGRFVEFYKGRLQVDLGSARVPAVVHAVRETDFFGKGGLSARLRQEATGPGLLLEDALGRHRPVVRRHALEALVRPRAHR